MQTLKANASVSSAPNQKSFAGLQIARSQKSVVIPFLIFTSISVFVALF